MSVFKHIVETELKFVTRNGKKIEETTRQIENHGRGITHATTAQKKWNKEGIASVTTTERNIKGFQRFQMEHLGVMFAGMALNRAMSNLNATAREWLGIGELTSTMMGVTMLGANMDLLQFGVLPLFDALTSLPGAAQKAIGYVSIGLEGLGATMMVGGQLALGINSTILLLEKMGIAAGTTMGLLKRLAGIGLIGIGVTLGIASVNSEGGGSILMALGSAIGIAFGAVLLGASAATGIALGVITVSAILAWKFSQESKGSKAFQDANPFGTDRIESIGSPGGTGIITPRINPDIDLNKIDLTEGISGNKVSLAPTYNIQISDKREFEEMLRKNNIELTAEVGRMIQK